MCPSWQLPPCGALGLRLRLLSPSLSAQLPARVTVGWRDHLALLGEPNLPQAWGDGVGGVRRAELRFQGVGGEGVEHFTTKSR